MGDEVESLGWRVFLYFGSSTWRGVEVIFFKKVGGVEVFVIDPRVIGVWVILPMYEILKGLLPSISSRIENSFDLVFFFFFFKDGWWTCVGFSVCFHGLVRR